MMKKKHNQSVFHRSSVMELYEYFFDGGLRSPLTGWLVEWIIISFFPARRLDALCHTKKKEKKRPRKIKCLN